MEESLRLLGYDRRWVTYGFLSPEELAQQCETFAASDDQNPEHYRYASFRRVLAQRSCVSDAALGRYLELAALDTNEAMAGSALRDLLMWHGLSVEQFEHLSTHPAYQVGFLQRLVRWRRLTSVIATGPASDALFASCLTSKDSEVQRALVEAGDITREQLEVVVREGCTRAVRNLARQRLGHRFQDPPN